MRRALILWVSVWSLGAGLALAQTAPAERDVELWLGAGVKYDATDQLQLTLEQQLRFDDNVSAVKNYHTELQLEFEFLNNMEFFGATRFIRRNDNRGAVQGYENHFRYQVGLTYGHRLRPLELDYRVIYQHRNELQVSAADGDVARQFMRFRTRATYKIRNWKYDPQFRIEYFEAFDEAAAGIDDGIRFGIGTERDFDELGELGFHYFFERTLGAEIPEHAHIFSLRYSYRF
jgi:hypothetical protein